MSKSESKEKEHNFSPSGGQNQQVIVNVVGHTGQTGGVLQKNWGVALGLAICLGWFGIDSFYLGQTGKGLLKMFTFGLFGILWIIDIVQIATKNVKGIEWE